MNDARCSQPERAAAHLMVVASTYGGFETGGFKGRHKLRPNVDGFIPSRRALAMRVRSLCIPKNLRVVHGNAEDIEPYGACVYIDPPYRGTTKYLADFPREAVVSTALRWWRAGSRVVVSEAEPIKELVENGWKIREISSQRRGQVRTNSRRASEWLTFSPQ